jgi:protein-S-isoprenylcysteine O-methyltransferase Ste14
MLKDNFEMSKVAVIKQLLLTSFFLFVQIVIFFVSAGFSMDSRSWFYFVTAFVHYLVSITLQFKFNPELLVQRLKIKRSGSKFWDEILMRFSNLMVILLVPMFAGLDYRFKVSLIGSVFVLLGFIFVIVSSILLNWAMILNPYFEPTVRIQKERNHKVITKGPYNIVRHPGYLAGILFAFSIPLLIGSSLAFISVGIYAVSMILRTWLEDKTLTKELEGYSEYVNQVRYRLFPGLW